MDGKRFTLCQWLVAAAWLAAASASASEPQVNNGAGYSRTGASSEGCLVGAATANLQAMKNMARKWGPEAVLDLMFSSVNPEFQPTLLSRPTSAAKPVRTPEDMLQSEYVQHAITFSDGLPQWVKARLDGRLFPVAGPGSGYRMDKDWLRQQSIEKKDKGDGEATSRSQETPSKSTYRY